MRILQYVTVKNEEHTHVNIGLLKGYEPHWHDVLDGLEIRGQFAGGHHAQCYPVHTKFDCAKIITC